MSVEMSDVCKWNMRASDSKPLVMSGDGQGVPGVPAPPLPHGSEGAMYQKYLALCQQCQCQPVADALVRLQLGCPDLVLNPLSVGRYSKKVGDMDFHAVATLLEDSGGVLLSRLRSLDLSSCRLGPSGAMLVGRLLRHPQCHLESVDLSRQLIGAEGVAAIADAIRINKTVRRLLLQSCRFGPIGGNVLAELLDEGPSVHGLEHLDIQNNVIGHMSCKNIRRAVQDQGDHLKLYMHGNRVLDEVLNATSHGIGIVLSIVGTVFLAMAAAPMPSHYCWAIVPYCISLTVLYSASTLFHSFFALGPQVTFVFETLDHCAIYVLIAGTYSPFLVILFHHEFWARVLLSAIWIASGLGIMTTAFYYGPGKVAVEVGFYLVEGWACVMCLGPMFSKLGPGGSELLLLGGLLYTAGVPWFLRDGWTLGVPDHTIWHLFVLAASMAHYFCILYYVVRVPDFV